MHCTLSFFKGSGQNPYFHPGSDDLAFLLGSTAIGWRSGGKEAVAFSTKDLHSGVAEEAVAVADEPVASSFTGGIITSTLAARCRSTSMVYAQQTGESLHTES